LSVQRRELDEAARLYLAAKRESKPFDPAEFGFEFSIEEIEHYVSRRASRPTSSDLLQAA